MELECFITTNNLKEKLRKCLVKELAWPYLQAHLQFTQAKNCKRAYKAYPKIMANAKHLKKYNDNEERPVANNSD